MRKLFLLTSALFALLVSQAQTNLNETLKAQFIKDWERAKAYTNEYLEAMPADKYSFKAQDSIRSFAQQMLHLAQGNIGLSANATGKKSPWPGRRLELSASAQSKDSVVYYVNASYDFIIDGIKNMDFTKLDEKANFGNFSDTKLAWLLKVFEHQTHHRGQTTIYIRLVGIKPPNEKLF
jgi:uncharacterized damage-inducible protein DinB